MCKILLCNRYIKTIEEVYISFFFWYEVLEIQCVFHTRGLAPGPIGSLPRTSLIITCLCSTTFSGSLLPNRSEPAACHSDLCFSLPNTKSFDGVSQDTGHVPTVPCCEVPELCRLYFLSAVSPSWGV